MKNYLFATWTIIAAWALLAATPRGAAADAVPTRTVVFFGDSLTAGYGLADPDTESYPSQVQRHIDAEHLPWRVVNAGLSGETSAGGLRRIDWVLNQKADILVLELGANDGLRGTATEVTSANLQGIIDHVRARYPDTRIVLAGMMMPPSMGQDYTDAFRAIYPALAKKNGLTLIPFLLDKVAAIPELNQGDGIHPTAAGAKIVADGVWVVLRPILVKNGP
ncbi:MAG TPA: arylesterase [Opitutaceae bacterium]|nr:arylesterase [Opitutaceae bacterium]